MLTSINVEAYKAQGKMFEILQEFLGDGVKGQSVAAFYL
jgi:hypothetical protein